MPKKATTAPRTRGGAYDRLRELAPAVVDAYEGLSAATREAGPLGATSVALFKVAISIGRGSSRTTHAHARKALELEVEPDVLRHIPILALPTIGLPAALDAMRWIDESIAEFEARLPAPAKTTRRSRPSRSRR
ncbi:MAG: carboxymuconolactone decarboxylase family protein [Acidobacteria bacterium]|nr:carboxymuconolactone decarboxylase family protein [Acidobacteriota bacterium]